MAEATMRAALAAADAEIARRSPEVSRGPRRLRYHLMPATGWMNDPNGFVQFRGEFHLFFQFWPFGAEHGTMHWGHAISPDLVHWRTAPTALAPSEEYDYGESSASYGCYSGSAVVVEDELVLMYTGHVYEREPMQTQCLAVSEDGLTFHKHPANPVIPGPPAGGGIDFRDPKVVEHGGQRYAVVGASARGRGRALLYRGGDDITEWTYVGALAESTGPEGTMWECPDLFPLGDRCVLLVSPMHGVLNTAPFVQVGDLDTESGRFTAAQTQVLDGGIDFYAPQTMVDAAGRRILVAWMQQWHQRNVTAVEGWAGAMTVPRELTLVEGRVRQRPVVELEALRGEPTHLAPRVLEGETLDAESGIAADVRIVLGGGTARAARIGVRASVDRGEQTVFVIDRAEGRVVCDRSLSGVGDATGSVIDVDLGSDPIELRLLLDACSVELFVNDGVAAMTHRIYPAESSTGLFIEPIGSGTLEVLECTIWPMASAFEVAPG